MGMGMHYLKYMEPKEEHHC